MKKLFSVLVFSFISVFAFAQESEEEDTAKGPYKYFIATNSGVFNTPVGVRIGVLEKMGGYIGVRFGKGNSYKEDRFNHMEVEEATMFAATAGFIFPITYRHPFKVHAFFGLGYGKWFDRPSQNGQTMGGEFETGLMLSYRRVMLNMGGTLLTGDGNSPRGDMTLGVGLRF